MSRDPTNDVRLIVNGTEYGGWKSVRISAGIERQARDFELSVTDRWPGQSTVRRIQAGDACQVFIGGDLVLTGYVDATPIKYDAKSISVSMRGRSKTADLVDCCPAPSGMGAAKTIWVDVKGPPSKTAGAGRGFAQAQLIAPPLKTSNQWHNQKLEVIAAALAAPYNVRVLSEIDTGRPIPEHQVQIGETVFESIDRMMRLRHVLSTDNEQGDLVLIDVGSAGRATTAIEFGMNVEAGSADLDYKGVFSQYIVKGQRAGTDDIYASDASEVEGETDDDSATSATVITDTATATDARAKRKRILVIKQSGQADDGTSKDRAEYERAHRAAKALESTYTLTGWRQDSGALWLPNMLVQVRDPAIGFDTEMVIAEVSYVIDAQGTRTEVRVGPQDGYVSKAGKLKKSKKGGGPEWSDVR